MGCSQTGGELDIDVDDEVASFAGIPREHHAQAGVSLFVARLGWARFGNANRFSIDGSNDSLPPGQGFFQCEFNCRDQAVPGALEDRVWKL